MSAIHDTTYKVTACYYMNNCNGRRSTSTLTGRCNQQMHRFSCRAQGLTWIDVVVAHILAAVTLSPLTVLFEDLHRLYAVLLQRNEKYVTIG
jgi:hypothetical protein